MPKFKRLKVLCECGLHLADYKKGGSGRLRKMYFERILEDVSGLFLKIPPLTLNTEITCPACDKRIGTVQVVSGKYAVKINQGVVRL